MKNLVAFIFTATFALSTGFPTQNYIVETDNDLIANSLDGDPVSSEVAELYKQQLLQQQKLKEHHLEEERLILEKQHEVETGKHKMVDPPTVQEASSTVQSSNPSTVQTNKPTASVANTESSTFEGTTTVFTSSPSTVSSSQPDVPTTSPASTTTSTSKPTTTSTSEPTTTPRRKQKPQHSGGVISRIIDDIFQIPISVLQSVARLLRNPFATKRTPESASTY